MTGQKTSKPGSPEKRLRGRDELEHQADIFIRDWRSGDRVMTWLNRHEGKSAELTRLLEDGWSWADIGRAMHLAGIAYRSGAPISPAILRKKASEARAAARAKSAQSSDVAEQESGRPIPLSARHRPLPLPSPDHVAVRPAVADLLNEDDYLAFRPATLIGHRRQESAEVAPPLAKQPAPAPEINVAAILAKFTGRK